MPKKKTIFQQIKQLFAMSHKSDAYSNYRYICMQFAEHLVKRRNTKLFLICDVKPEEVHDFIHEVDMGHNAKISYMYWCALKILEDFTCKFFRTVNWEISEEKILQKCPYCGSNSKLVDSKLIYGISYGMAYVCEKYPACDAYVGTHKGTIWPRGTLANKELRNYRKKAHLLFDSIWEAAGISRTQAYKWLAKKLDIPLESAHIGYFDLSMCQKVINICMKKELDFDTGK